MEDHPDADGELTALLLRIAQGDRAAFASFYRLTSPHLFGIVLRILKRSDLAEDALQEICVRIWRGAADYMSTRGSVRAWISSIARYQAIDMLRRSQSRPMVDPEADPETLPAGECEPDAMVAEWAFADLLRRCLELLPSGHQRMIRAAFYDGYSYAEVSRITGTPLGTVKSWIRRGLRQLRDCVDRDAPR